jgi:hypothetical protein
MALPFFSIMGGLMPMLPDGGIYDPESGLSYTSPSTGLPSGNFNNVSSIIGDPRYENQTEFTSPLVTSNTTIGDPRYENPVVSPKVVTPTTSNPPVIVPTVRPTVTPTSTVTSGVGVSTSDTDKRNAREFLLGTLRQYFSSEMDKGFITDLEKIIDDYVRQDYDVETISVLLPQTEPYKKRFAGNEKLISSGMAPLSPAEYLQAESQYNEILRRFNLTDLSTRDTFNTLIGGQVSAAELTDRVVNVYDRIRNADPELRKELDRVESLGGNITDADFAKALLTGPEGANELKRKIATAEISSEARTRGLSTTSAQELQQRGITRQQASAGFEQIRLTQPTMEKLSDIYRRDTAPGTEEERVARTQEFQTELEREQFGGLASERRRRLAEQEQTSFMGQSGTASGISLGRRRRGQF